MSETRGHNKKVAISYVRVGSFSGIGIALRDALGPMADLTDFDALSLSRAPRMAAARLAATLEARGGAIPWNKTGAWSRAVQRYLIREGIVGTDRHTLFIQTLLVPVLEPDFAYSIFTDRVALENVVPGSQFRSRFSPAWIERERRFLQGASNVFVMGPNAKATLVEQYGLSPQTVHVVGSGSNCTLGAGNASSACRRLLFVGIDWERKGGPLLLEAFEHARLRHPTLELTIVGGRPTGHVPDGVTVMGRVPHEQVGAIYSAADALVIPTHSEAFGVALVEALSNGIPCVGTTVGNQPWIIGDAGICVQPDRATDLADALHELVERYGEYKAAADERAVLFRTHMTWDAVAHKIAGSILEGRVPDDVGGMLAQPSG